MLRTYYFDMKDGVAVRDRMGLDLPSDGAAIAHCRSLAETVRKQSPNGHPDLRIVVVDESSREIHREQIYPKEN